MWQVADKQAIMAELPMVCMPFAADQGEFAELRESSAPAHLLCSLLPSSATLHFVLSPLSLPSCTVAIVYEAGI